jgi:crossover junction endodeoxyribonuclease RuvC
MVVIGIDPGLSTTGYGIIEVARNEIKPLEFGGIRTSPGVVLSVRLDKIFQETEALFARWRPDVVVVERLFFSSNARSAMSVGEARGVILLAAQRAGAEIYEYTPLEVKLAMVGEGRGEKGQVKYMVKALLGLREEIPSTHASDALALALCFVHSSGWRNKVGKSERKVGEKD